MDTEPRSIFTNRNPWRKRQRRILFVLCVVAALAFNIGIAVYLANDNPDDGKLYSQMAVNMLAHRGFSADSKEPFTPTLIRLPGYPLFLAAVYSVFGTGNNTAVRVVQAVFYTSACVLAAITATNWLSGKKRGRRKAGLLAFVLTAFCPFTVIFSAVILTETLTMFFLAAILLASTYAFKANRNGVAIFWWILAGLAAGIAVLLRPDSGLFAFGIGFTLVLSVFFLRRPESTWLSKITGVLVKGIMFSAAFIAVLVPWTVRNDQVFGVFQPLAPAHAEMPGQFVPHGYYHWLRTWIDDSKYIGPMLWDLEIKPIPIEAVPAFAFASEEEKNRVAVLLDQYNNSDPHHPLQRVKKQDEADSDNADDEDAKADDDQKEDAPDTSDTETAWNEEWDLKISPETDAGFEEIARERIAREPFRYYVSLPAKRAAGMWFDTHSDYYPFGGELFPLKDIDEGAGQQFWLPLFGGLSWLYSLLAVAGIVLQFMSRRRDSGFWILLVLLISLPRIIFFGTLENPEPRYLVELFMPTAMLAALAISRLRFVRRTNSIGLNLHYGND